MGSRHDLRDSLQGMAPKREEVQVGEEKWKAGDVGIEGLKTERIDYRLKQTLNRRLKLIEKGLIKDSLELLGARCRSGKSRCARSSWRSMRRGT